MVRPVYSVVDMQFISFPLRVIVTAEASTTYWMRHTYQTFQQASSSLEFITFMEKTYRPQSYVVVCAVLCYFYQKYYVLLTVHPGSTLGK